jgi:hypothetical protein
MQAEEADDDTDVLLDLTTLVFWKIIGLLPLQSLVAMNLVSKRWNALLSGEGRFRLRFERRVCPCPHRTARVRCNACVQDLAENVNALVETAQAGGWDDRTARREILAARNLRSVTIIGSSSITSATYQLLASRSDIEELFVRGSCTTSHCCTH